MVLMHLFPPLLTVFVILVCFVWSISSLYAYLTFGGSKTMTWVASSCLVLIISFYVYDKHFYREEKVYTVASEVFAHLNYYELQTTIYKKTGSLISPERKCMVYATRLKTLDSIKETKQKDSLYCIAMVNTFKNAKTDIAVPGEYDLTLEELNADPDPAESLQKFFTVIGLALAFTIICLLLPGVRAFKIFKR
jgi:hypothetical protein